MKNSVRITLSLFLFLFVVSPTATHADPSADGNALLNISLPLPSDAKQQQYLGLTAPKEFKILQIKSEIVIVEIFSMY